MTVEFVEEVFWFASCACGWETKAPNDPAETCVNKVSTHLRAVHPRAGADVVITGVIKARVKGRPPFAEPPDPDVQIDGALARLSHKRAQGYVVDAEPLDGGEALAEQSAVSEAGEPA